MRRSNGINKSKGKGWLIASIAFVVLGSPSRESRAGIVLNSGSLGISDYQLDGLTGSNGAGPTFSNGMLITPGGGFPSLAGILPETPSQLAVQSPISSNFITNATTDPNSPTGYVPFGFGTATTDILATVVGGNGTSSARGGIFWVNDTTLADNLGGSTGSASVSVSTAQATFLNNGTSAVDIRNPGALLSVTGSIGSSSSSYVAAGLASSYTLMGGGLATTTTTLGSIALAANAGGISIASNGGGGGAGSARLLGGLLSATGSSTSLLSDLMLQPGQSIQFTATLTLISDPGSSISISTDLAPGFPGDPGLVPGFGAFAGGPVAVPEPSTVVLLFVGLPGAILQARGLRRKKALARG